MSRINLRLCVLVCVMAIVVAAAPTAAQSLTTPAATPTLAAQIAAMAAMKNADEPAPGATDPAPAGAEPQRQRQPPPPGGTSGPMTVVPVHNSFVFQPTVRFGQVNHQNATFVGGNAGILLEDRLFFGAGGQWLANNEPGFAMSYLGFVAGWRAMGSKAVDINVSSLIGGGWSDSTYYDYYAGGHHGGGYGYYYYGENIFVFEPQVDVVLRLARNAWITAGVSYRLVGGSYGSSDLSGVTGAVSITFGTR